MGSFCTFDVFAWRVLAGSGGFWRVLAPPWVRFEQSMFSACMSVHPRAPEERPDVCFPDLRAFPVSFRSGAHRVHVYPMVLRALRTERRHAVA
jgi:hypothetical protein